jgi:hypothetical protein
VAVNTSRQVNKCFAFFGLIDTLLACERFFSYKVKILVELKRKGLVVSCSSVVLPRLKEFVTKGKVLCYLEFDSGVSRILTAPNFKVSAKKTARQALNRFRETRILAFLC